MISARTIVYKGIFLAFQLGAFYLDLHDESVESAIALVHQRFSTNTSPSWGLPYPYRMTTYNGEINIIRDNVNWMAARQASVSSPSSATTSLRSGRSPMRVSPTRPVLTTYSNFWCAATIRCRIMYRIRGEQRAWSPDVVADLQYAVRTRDDSPETAQQRYDSFAAHANSDDNGYLAILNLFEIKPIAAPVALDE